MHETHNHDKYIKYLLSFADEMVSDSEKDTNNKKILLDLADSYIKHLMLFYENEKIDCLQGLLYQKLGWIKYQQENFQIAEKHFLYSIINLKNCKNCIQELADSYWGLINTYVKFNKLKIAKKYFLIFYSLMNDFKTINIEEDTEKMILTLNLSAQDLLKK